MDVTTWRHAYTWRKNVPPAMKSLVCPVGALPIFLKSAITELLNPEGKLIRGIVFIIWIINQHDALNGIEHQEFIFQRIPDLAL